MADENKKTKNSAAKKAIKVMVCDDLWDQRTWLRAMVEWCFQQINMNVTIVEGFDGMHGYKIAIEERPDVLITDTSMPGMMGYQLAMKVRAYCKCIIGTSSVPSYKSFYKHLPFVSKPELKEWMRDHFLQLLQEKGILAADLQIPSFENESSNAKKEHVGNKEE